MLTSLSSRHLFMWYMVRLCLVCVDDSDTKSYLVAVVRSPADSWLGVRGCTTECLEDTKRVAPRVTFTSSWKPTSNCRVTVKRYSKFENPYLD